ncbi:hypothetical protein D9611_009217 [Ephemerocybe angulata]|uniref:Uncharacterized protein n=1 Tax=Ephemerocybe angulata TaxID=980116 RepID=A0A8H5BGT5_9AGAR|nr:hypothetical protein D9611_009217 [Tulosesus angulatus]
MSRPSYLSREDPYEALCHHFNVQPVQTTDAAIPATFDMTVTRDAHMPTHVLAAVPTDDPECPPLMLPIDASLYEHGFRIDINIPAAEAGSTAPVPYIQGDALIVTLPVLPITVPDTSSLALLLLFGLSLETIHNLLAWRLLPSQVIEEFPNAATMALILSRARQDQFDRIFRFNQGLWRNALSLGLKDAQLVQLIQTAWNVTAEARRIRTRSSTGSRR